MEVQKNFFKIKIILLPGEIKDDNYLREIYSIADVFVLPSQENYSNSLVESLACGTPVTGFNIGGNFELIKDGITGYIVRVLQSL